MCGIVGWYSSQEVQDARVLLKRMLSALAHRGPDDEGLYFQGPIALGIRRLSIIDVQGGHQPISNEDRTIWVGLNGEIYNFQELRRELEAEGHVFATRTDTEVIVHAYEEWSDDCIRHLNGIFGLVIWDSLRCRLLMARDHFGVKPLYYFDDGKRLIWASEIKAILVDSSIPRKVDLEALDLYLTLRFVPSPWTMFDRIRKLPPGHVLIKDATGCKVTRYFTAEIAINHKLSERDWIALLQERLETAVRRQMMSDVPIGALLSGGIDSGVVVAIMSKLIDHPVRTFTVGFEGSHEINELEEARKTAALLETAHEDILLTCLDCRQLLEKAIWHLDEPIANDSALAMYAVCELARKHVKVVLTGQGADEPFAGYTRHLGERYSGLFRLLPRPLRQHLVRPLVDSLLGLDRLKRAARSLGIEDVSERFAQVYAVFSSSMKAALWRPGMVNPNDSGRVRGVIEYWRQGIESLNSMIQMSYVDARLSLSDELLMYGDKMSMAASIEARVPVLDLDYMQAVESLPASMRIRGLTQKYIHKKVVAKWLPPEIINRRKHGFSTPLRHWFRSELSGYVRTALLSESSVCPMFFRREAIEALIREDISGREVNWLRLLTLLVFELWHRRFICDPLG